MTDSGEITLASVRPVVRYVDDERAVVDAWFALSPTAARELGEAGRSATVSLQIEGSDGFFEEAIATLEPGQQWAKERIEIVQPQRWWPAGMGEQPLYQLTVTLQLGEERWDEQAAWFGLTSVRPAGRRGEAEVGGEFATDPPRFLVNGQPCALSSIVTVDRVDENQLLPVTGDSLLVVTDHYAPELLYQAADQAGILMVQCVPVDAEADPERTVRQQIDRLTPHPSLAGYVVGHLGKLSERLARHLNQLDPTRLILRQPPGSPAA
jgi:beta-galactosidase/beta-glucuronidase